MIIKDFEWEHRPYLSSRPIVNGQILSRIENPARHRIVYIHDVHNPNGPCLRPVLILEGQYESMGRISNTWSWLTLDEDMNIGEEESGYGYFFESPFEFKVNVQTIYNVTKIN